MANKRKLLPAQRATIRALYAAGGISQAAIAERYGVNPATIKFVLTETDDTYEERFSAHERAEIVRMYDTGQWSYRRLADVFHCSYNTIANIVNGTTGALGSCEGKLTYNWETERETREMPPPNAIPSLTKEMLMSGKSRATSRRRLLSALASPSSASSSS
jgi:transposase-like protein